MRTGAGGKERWRSMPDKLPPWVTMVDGAGGLAQLQQYSECLKRAAIADPLLVTKTDIAAAVEIETLVRTCGTSTGKRSRLAGSPLRLVVRSRFGQREGTVRLAAKIGLGDVKRLLNRSIM